jgi:hypothetical protein
MSFILDALKKSENERQRQGGPALFEVKVAAPPPRFPVWAIALGALLAVNLLVLGGILLWRSGANSRLAPGNPASGAPTASAPAPQPSSTARPGTQSGATSAAGVPATAAGPSVAPVAPAAGTSANASAARFNPPLVEESDSGGRASPVDPRDYQPAVGSSGSGAAGAGNSNAGAGPGAAPASQAAAAAQAERHAGLPSREDVINSGGPAVPEVSLSLHVFDRDPAARFVFVNNQRAREGEVLQNGVRVEQITPEGAVLSFGGARFLLPIP